MNKKSENAIMGRMMRPLEVLEIDQVHDWLRSLEMPVNRLLHRDYADGVLVAQLLKKLFPRHVELHNYQRRFSQNLKVVNWRALESKVLKRLGIKLTTEQIETLARGEAGTIERLLWLIMKQTNDGKTLNSELRQQKTSTQSKTPPTSGRKRRIIRCHHKDGCKAKNAGNARLPATVVLTRRKSFMADSESGSDKNQSKSHIIKTNSIGKSNARTSGKVAVATSTTTVTTTMMTHTNSSAANINHARQTMMIEKALNEFRAKIATLEQMLKKRDHEIQTLLQRERGTAAKSPELRRILGSFRNRPGSNVRNA